MVGTITETDGNEAQFRLIVRTMIEQERELQSKATEQPPHPLVKWVVGAVAAFGSAALIGLGFWLVTSVSSMLVTLGRMDERMANYTTAQAVQMQQLEGRVSDLEKYHREGSR